MRNLALLLSLSVSGCVMDGPISDSDEGPSEDVVEVEADQQELTTSKTYTVRNVNDGTFNVPDWADQQVAWCNAMRNPSRTYWCTYQSNWQGTWCGDRSNNATKINFFSELVSWEDSNGAFHDQVYIYRLNGPLDYSTEWVYEGVADILQDDKPYAFDYNGAVWDLVGSNTGKCYVDRVGNITMTTKQAWF